jgi:cell division protein YceG involved in septum cleavage
MVQKFSGKKRKYGSNKRYSGLKLILLFLLILFGGLGVSLVQAGMSGKQAFWSRFELIVNFANPTQRFVYIYPGMRREEIVEKYSDILNWSEKDKLWFMASAPAASQGGGFEEGYFLPKAYIVSKDATGKEVGTLMHQEFIDAVAEKVLSQQGPKLKASIESIIGDDKNATLRSAESFSHEESEKNDDNDGKNNTNAIKALKTPDDLDLDTAVRIASIIQREAAGPHDMRIISGIIWNRISKGMSLELDATLQYVKGNEDNWWPMVKSKDKYLDSPYNTYKYKGIPPGAISNPSIDAINAVYNPQKTDCIFYLHDDNRKIHCSKTYDQHLANIRAYL